jgi:hypothetical protein
MRAFKVIEARLILRAVEPMVICRAFGIVSIFVSLSDGLEFARELETVTSWRNLAVRLSHQSAQDLVLLLVMISLYSWAVELERQSSC